MSFTRLLDDWHASEQTRTRMRPGRRWARMEYELADREGLADMTPNRHHWRDIEVLTDNETNDNERDDDQHDDAEIGVDEEIGDGPEAPRGVDEEIEDEVDDEELAS